MFLLVVWAEFILSTIMNVSALDSSVCCPRLSAVQTIRRTLKLHAN